MEDNKTIYIFGEPEEKFKQITLDYHNNIVWDRNTSNFKNLLPLYYLPKGLFELASKMRRLEEEIVIDMNGRPSVIIIDLPKTDILNCYFQWFSTSIINYLRLIAFVELTNENGWNENDLSEKNNKQTIKEFTKNYISNIIPDIVKWRNKIGAHYSIFDPVKQDSINTMLNSVYCTVSYDCPYYIANLYKFVNSQTDGGEVEIPTWSLTKTYDDLTERFFPSQKLKSLEQIRNDTYISPKDNPILEMEDIYKSSKKTFNHEDRIKINNLINEGTIAINNKNNQKLFEVCIEGLLVQPNNIEFIRNLSILLLEKNENPYEAKRLIEFGLQKHKKSVDLLLLYATLFNLFFNDRKKALYYYEKAKKIDHRHSEIKKFKKKFDRMIVSK